MLDNSSLTEIHISVLKDIYDHKSIREMAAHLGAKMSISTVQAAIRKLEEEGLVENPTKHSHRGRLVTLKGVRLLERQNLLR